MGEPGPMCWGMEIPWPIVKDWMGDIHLHMCNRERFQVTCFRGRVVASCKKPCVSAS